MTIERINATATNSPPAAWDICIPVVSKVADVQDGSDASSICSNTAGEIERFVLNNPTVITGSDTINHCTLRARARTSATSGQSRIKLRERDDNSAFQDSNNIMLSTSYVDYSWQFNVAPDGGAWTLAKLNTLQMQIINVSVPMRTILQCAEFYVDIDYTVSAVSRRVFVTSTA